MTKINGLVMHGFKSFAKRTELIFDNKFNVVLGPNGSGKSNVLDALCFVLGKRSAKSLRAEKAANLIYNGGKSKTPSKHAEVSIIFDNSNKTFPIDSETIKVTRIINQSGQSVYKINDKRHTRQQVLDLLALGKINPDGYNIILQGDITNFVNMSPTERREVLGEIAGISVYEEKKNKALRELEKVDVKLGEADIILKERGTYLKELRKERNQAMKFKELNDQINQNKASFLKMQMDGKQTRIDELENRKSNQEKDFKKFQEQISKLKDGIRVKKKEISEITETVDKKGDQNLTRLNKEVENLRVSIATNKTRVSSCDHEISRIGTRKNQLLKNILDIDDKRGDVLKEVDDLKEQSSRLGREEQDLLEKVSVFKKKNKLGEEAEQIERDIEGIDKSIEEHQIDSQQLSEKQHELFRKKDVLDIQIKTIDEKIAKVAQVRKENKGQVNALEKKRSEFKVSTLDLNKTLDEDSALAAQLHNARTKLLTVKEELSKVSARSIGIRERSLANVAVNNIIRNKSKFKGVHGVISDLGEVNSQYSLALEIAAGYRVKSIVVENDQVASDCINYLKINKLGVATFLPLNKLKEAKLSSGFKGKQGVHGSALDLISFDPMFKKAFSYVFGNTLVVENIDTSRNIGIGSVRMVTLNGDLMEVSGAMQGGFRKRSQGLGFKEKELSKSLSELENRSRELEKVIDVLEKKRIENEDLIQELREKKANLEGDIIKSEKSLHLDEDDLSASQGYKDELLKEQRDAEKSLENVQRNIAESNKKLIDIKTRKQKLKEKIGQIKNPILLAELNSFEQKRHEVREEIIKVDANMKNFQTQASDMMSREKESTNKILKQLEREHHEFGDEIITLREKIKGQQKELGEKDENVKNLYSKFRGLFDKRMELSDSVNKEENNVDKFVEKSHTIEQKINMISLDGAKYKAEFAGLEEEFSQYKGVKLVKKQEEQLKKEIRDFERMRQNIGSVNMKALEIYESVERQFNELLDKKNKLDDEKGEILNMMGEVEGKKTDIFMKTFDEINGKFQEVFSKISTKGSQVYLELENKQKPFEGGMNIKAKITGTRYLDIRSLSGGEKTLTALAFIFSIQEYDPASFYILDEVDAALDKHNSEKLAGLIRQYSANAQYVMISHNDAIISEANNLYGLTMDEHGISKVVSLKI